MKKMMLILVMLLIAATSYNQASRRSANKSVTARNTSSRSAHVKATPQDTRTSTRTSTRASNNQTTQSSTSKQAATARPASRTSNNNRTATQSNNGKNRSDSYTRTQSTSTTVTRTTPDRSTSTYNHNNTNRQATTRSTVTYNSPRVYRQKHTVHHHYKTVPQSIEYRRVHYVYRAPVNVYYYWTPTMHRHFVEIYPMVPRWKYYNGYHIQMISAYDAMYYRGEVMTVYGNVSDVYYSPHSDEYFLYFGPYYPYQDFTVVMPGYLARRYSRHPERFFTNRHIAVTGLITTYEGEPEIVVKKDFQLHLY